MAYKLLLADDSVTIQRVIELTFADEDIEVVAVGDGQQAIERIRADRPDIVLADVGMPGRDGFEVAAFVKDDAELRHIPVLLLTGAFEPVDEARVRAVGCDGVLAKPFEPQLLIARVKQLLAAPAGRPQPPEAPVAPADVPVDDRPLDVPPEPALADGTPSFDHLVAGTGGDARASLDDYFDELDAAFASRGVTTDPAPVGDQAVRTTVPSAFPSVQLPQGFAPSRPAGSEPAADSGTSQATPATPARRDTPVSPDIAAAFEWLLAAEEGQPLPPDALPMPGFTRRSEAIDAIAEEVTRRVVERLADRAVRDAVADIVSSLAERLVRDEIERLKALK